MERIFVVCRDTLNDPNKIADINLQRKNFIQFVEEHDKRRNTNFLETFPEFESFFNLWK